jgi:hypothetical protein
LIGKWGGNLRDRYLGVRFLIDGKTHYGWIRLTVTAPSAAGQFMSAMITGYAYETVPNKPISAGTAGTASATAVKVVSKPTAQASVPKRVQNQGGPALGMLALGAEALPIWRLEETPGSN